MKKFLLVFLVFLILPVNDCAAISDDIYVRKDVFDAKMEAFMAEIRLGNEQIRKEMDKRFNEIDKHFVLLEAKISILDERTKSIKTIIYCGISFLGIILVFAPSLLEYLKSLREPKFTLDDVNKLIEENNAKLMKILENFTSANVEFAGK